MSLASAQFQPIISLSLSLCLNGADEHTPTHGDFVGANQLLLELHEEDLTSLWIKCESIYDDICTLSVHTEKLTKIDWAREKTVKKWDDEERKKITSQLYKNVIASTKSGKSFSFLPCVCMFFSIISTGQRAFIVVTIRAGRRYQVTVWRSRTNNPLNYIMAHFLFVGGSHSLSNGVQKRRITTTIPMIFTEWAVSISYCCS